MRSQKSRSRSKSNRSRSVGNIVNRVFDSSGPEGKVRGTPQQIIEKYTQLARDAQLGNDRVAAENFQQHAEHYTRMLGEAQREQDARREQQELANRDRQRERHDNGNNNQQQDDRNSQGRDEAQGRDQQQDDRRAHGRDQRSDSMRSVDQSASDQPDVIEDEIQSPPQPDLAMAKAPAASDVIDVGSDQSPDSGLVETPESNQKPKPKPRSRPRTRKPKPEAAADGQPAETPGNGGPAEAAE